MTIEVAILLSCVSIAFAIFFGLSNQKRNQRIDDKTEASQLTTVIVKLETIGTGVTEIKNELKSVKNDMRDHRDRIVVLEQFAIASDKRHNTCEKNCKFRQVGDQHEQK